MYLSLAVVGVRGFALGKAFFRYSERLVLHDAMFRDATEVRVNIFQSLVAKAPVGLRENSLGKLLTTLVDDTEESLNLNLRYRPALIQSVVATLAGFLVYLWLVPSDAWIMFAALFLAVGTSYLGSRYTFGRAFEALNQSRGELAELVENLVASNRIIRAYGWEERRLDRLQELSIGIQKLEAKIAARHGLLQSAITLLMYSSIGASVWIALDSGALFPGEQVAVLVLLPLGIFEYLQALPNAMQARARASASEARITGLLAEKVPHELQFDGTESLTQFEALKLVDVQITYPSGQTVALPNLEFGLGESISLLASSGAGKTTFANTLVGFLRPSAGHFEINGKQIEAFSGESLRSVFGLVEQQPIVLAGTIRDNLLLAKPDASDDELTEVLSEVALWQMLELRQGLETQVGQFGQRLSGGEAQRLALARNFLAKRQVIVLDEPTASVDESLARALIKQILEKSKSRGVSVVLITHDQELASLASRSVQF